MKFQRIFVATIFCLVSGLAGTASAQATRTWVSGVGDDVNPCSRTAPCKTFAGAISKTQDGGIISALDPGGYGSVTITKSITLDGSGTNASLLAAGTSGVTISGVIPAGAEVFLRNLTIEGQLSTGVRILGAAAVHLENVTITDVTGRCVDSTGTGAMLYVLNSRMHSCDGGGIYVQNARATISNVHVTNSQYGVRVGPGGLVTVKNSSASGGSMGFLAAGDASAVLNIEDSLTTHNDFGVVASNGATVRSSRVSIFSNRVTGLFNDGTGHLLSFGNNFLVGNTSNGVFTLGVITQ